MNTATTNAGLDRGRSHQEPILTTKFSSSLSHFGLYCWSIDSLASFYKNVFDMVETDRGRGISFPMDIVFLSSDPKEHHQLALATGRLPESPSTVMQLSFHVDNLDGLREARRRAEAHGGTFLRTLNHGNALSVYFHDPERNLVEVYVDTPWYVSQPHGDPLDLDRPDGDIWADTQKICQADPTFQSIEDWRASFSARLNSSGDR